MNFLEWVGRVRTTAGCFAIAFPHDSGLRPDTVGMTAGGAPAVQLRASVAPHAAAARAAKLYAAAK